jgi:hypothetical protein
VFQKAKKPDGDHLAIPVLAPAARLDQANPALAIQPVPEPLDKVPALLRSHGGTVAEVPPQLDPGRGLVDMLTARPAGAGRAVAHLGSWNAKKLPGKKPGVVGHLLS